MSLRNNKTLFVERALIKEVSDYFYCGEELITALATLSDFYHCALSIVYETNGRNTVLCSTELNLDRIEVFNKRLIRVRITESDVLSYDGYLKNHKEYLLKCGEVEGALLLDSEGPMPHLSKELLRILSVYTRHERLKRRAEDASLTDAVTGLKNRDGLMAAFADSFEYLACIRLVNRMEILNKLGCRFDEGLGIKCSNAILRILHRQVYRISADSWVALLIKGPEKEVLMKKFMDVSCDLSEQVSGAWFYISVTKIGDDPMYSLFLCESAAMQAKIPGVVFVESVKEGDLSQYMHTCINVEKSQLKDPPDFFQESAVYNLNRADSSNMEEEEPIKGEYVEVDEFGDPKSEQFEYGDAFFKKGEGNE